MKIGLGLQTSLTALDIIRYSIMAEKHGVDSVWISEDPFFRDALPIIGAIAYNTRKIKIGTCIVNAYTKHPVYMSMFALTANELAGGRFTLGIGRGLRSVIEGQMGIPYGKPLEYMSEYLTALRLLIAGREEFHGKYLRFNEARFFFPIHHVPRIVLAAMGPNMLSLSTRLADGVILNSCSSVSYVRWVSQFVREKVRSRDSEFTIAASIWTCITDDRAKVIDRLKLFVGFIVSIPRFGEIIMRYSSINESDLRDLRFAYKWDVSRNDPFWHLENADVKMVSEILDDKIVDELMVCGDVDYCVKRVEDYINAGVILPILFPMETSVEEVVKLIAKISDG